MNVRDHSHDGTRNRLEYHFLAHYGPFWRAIQKNQRLEKTANSLIINSLMRKTAPRPYPLSCSSAYPNWNGLTDQSWYSRHLPAHGSSDRPNIHAVLELFRESKTGPITSSTSSYLFPSFAQWFTDGFLLTDKDDGRRTSSSHQIDLNQHLRKLSRANLCTSKYFT